MRAAAILQGASDFHDDAQAHYLEARRQGGVYLAGDRYVCCDYDAAREILESDQQFRFTPPGVTVAAGFQPLIDNWAETSTGVKHQELRQHLGRAIKMQEETLGIAQLAADVVARVRVTGAYQDLTADVMRPLSAAILREWFGMPTTLAREVLPQFMRVSAALAADAAAQGDVEDCVKPMLDVMSTIWRPRHTRTGVVLALERTARGSPRAEDMSVRLLNLLVDVAPLVNAVGSCLAHFLSGERSVLQGATRRSTVTLAQLHDRLRVDPVQVILPRVAWVPQRFGEAELVAGARVVIVPGACHIGGPAPVSGRSASKPSLSFGYGTHACPGQGIVLRTVKTVVDGILRRYPRAVIASSVGWKPDSTIRTPVRLPVALLGAVGA